MPGAADPGDTGAVLEILEQRDHRPFPPPRGTWAMRMAWHDLLFAHWPVRPAALAPLLPPGLELDTWDGEAWLGVVPFTMEGVRLRLAPPWPSTERFCELNVRTYVRAGELPGVWFFSLDAASRLAVRVARRWFHLPYFDARMRACHSSLAVHYASERTHNGAPPAEFVARYRPLSPARPTEEGSLESWLTERYCLYASGSRGLYCGHVHHPRWELAPAEAELHVNTMVRPIGIELPDVAPLLHFSDRQEVVAWAPRRVAV